MQAGKLNIVTDAQWGSTGKGLITSYLAWKHRPHLLSTTNMANAGHTAVNEKGQAHVAKALPSASILNSWLPEYAPTVFVGATSAFDLDQILKEKTECSLNDEQLVIHPRAGVITEAHKLAETDDETGTKHIASTMQGCGSFLADKVLRKKDLRLARDYPELINNICQDQPHTWLNDKLYSGQTILHEGSQGFSLDISHGSHYPHCTSRGTTAIQNLADLGLSHTTLGDIYLVMRPYPIRVGNVIEDGIQKGYSGDYYEDHEETTWEAVAEAAGAPMEIKNKELTTVTKRTRRVFTLSAQQLKEAVQVNGATKIALNFANYIDWSVYGTSNLSSKVLDYIYMIEHMTGLKVALVGTGPRLDNVIEL